MFNLTHLIFAVLVFVCVCVVCTYFLNIVREVIDLFLEQPHEAFGHDAEADGDQQERASILYWNTWGDGLFVVFADPVTCSRFALVLLQKVHLTSVGRGTERERRAAGERATLPALLNSTHFFFFFFFSPFCFSFCYHRCCYCLEPGRATVCRIV